MVTRAELEAATESAQYQCQGNLNLYDSPELKDLATQAIAGRQLRIVSLPSVSLPLDSAAIEVCLCEDDYPGWMAIEDLDLLEPAAEPYRSISLSLPEITNRLPQVIAYTQAAMRQPNHYLWGGTIGSNYDCSGLMQAAFCSAGIWIPRDAYQQADFAQAIDLTEANPGDLIFFGGDRITHVGLYLGDLRYIHSSGKDHGRNGIAIDRLAADGDGIAQAYYQQFHSVGRITSSYQPVFKE
ncbi:C40 family peptidase [Microcoleus sp. FACHB-1515]|uniref:C40 family peptidase n=1 Tax=Cyanophyceae TaxID=3028117 RepID=UPI001689D19D|nr:C40 family peptidase [Microcoleus sp. FACHB-1515]MBD2090521.1 C40 family peptidase [Microcoleus sp. FACHB-1515]